MTWASVTTTGNGAIAFRLMILGHPYEFVSSSSLIGSGTAGRERIGGLDARSISWSESLDPAQCKLTARGCAVRIIEDGQHRTGDSFCRAPQRTLYLSSSISDVAVALPLDSTDTTNGDVLYLGQECVLITAGGGTAAPTVTRGYRQTLAQHHYVDASLGLSRPEVTDARPTIEGSLAFLYAYGDGETGDGTLVWRGIVAAQPKIRGLTTWEVALDSVASILDQSIGADLQDPVTLRGIVYTSNTVPTLKITRNTTGAMMGVPGDTAQVVLPHGFYESQATWCAAVNAAITSATSGWGANALNVASGAAPRVIAAPTDDGGWGFTVATNASGYWHQVLCSGPVDPYFSTLGPGVFNSAGVTQTSVSASSTYVVPASFPVPGAGTVPRGSIGRHYARDSRGRMASRDQLSAYLGGIATATTSDALDFSWPAFAGQPQGGVSYGVSAWDATDRFATLVQRTPGMERLYTSEALPEIKVSRDYVGAGHVGDFLAALVAGASAGAAAGRQPYITADHIDTTTTSANVAAAVAGLSWAAERYYGGSSDVPLAKMLTEECKLAGLVPSITTDGRYSLVAFRVGAGTEASAYDVTATTNLSGVQLPGFEPSAFGLLNTIKLMTGYDPLDGKHHGDTYIVRDAGALSRNPLPSTMKIEPRSAATMGDRGIPTADVLALAQSWLGVLGAAYATVTVTCPLSAIDCVIGTQATATISQLPDTESGGRGVSLLSGVVVGRAVKPLEATVELVLLTSQVRLAGYAPSSLVDTVSAGATRDVVLEAVQPTGYADVTWWAVGDAVVLRQYDVGAPSEITATVTSIDVAARKVTIGTISGATPAGVLTLECGADTAATSHQQAFCFIADDADAIAFATPVSARQFAA